MQKQLDLLSLGRFQLPDVSWEGETASIKGKERRLYRLRWPTSFEGEREIFLPTRYLKPWLGAYPTPEKDTISVREFVDNLCLLGCAKNLKMNQIGKFIEHLPEKLAHFLAVNAHTYYYGEVRHPVAGLPIRDVKRVLDARFIVDTDYSAGLKYLKWLAESHRHHPFFRGYDTIIRDGLQDIVHVLVRKYFWLLQDCLFDAETSYFSRAKDDWYKIATYMFWSMGITGHGLYGRLSKIPPQEDKRFENQYPGAMESIQDWTEMRGTRHREMLGLPAGGKATGPSLGGEEKPSRKKSPDPALKSKIETFLRAHFPQGIVDVSDGYQDMIHIVVVSYLFDGMEEQQKIDLVWEALDGWKRGGVSASLSDEEKGKISLVVPHSPRELK